MAKARWLKPEFFTDAKVSKASDAAALLFSALWTESDDGGVVPGDPRVIYGRCFITRVGWTVEKVDQALSELEGLGLVRLGSYQDQEWVLIPNLMKNQGMPPKKWRYLGESRHEQLCKQVFAENLRKSTFTPKPSLSLSPEPIAVLETTTPPTPQTASAPSARGVVVAKGPIPVPQSNGAVERARQGTATARELGNAIERAARFVGSYFVARWDKHGTYDLESAKRLGKLRARLEESYRLVRRTDEVPDVPAALARACSELCYAVDGSLRAPWIREHREYQTIETVLRDRGCVEKYRDLILDRQAVHPTVAEELAAAVPDA